MWYGNLYQNLSLTSVEGCRTIKTAYCSIAARSARASSTGQNHGQSPRAPKILKQHADPSSTCICHVSRLLRPGTPHGMAPWQQPNQQMKECLEAAEGRGITAAVAAELSSAETSQDPALLLPHHDTTQKAGWQESRSRSERSVRAPCPCVSCANPEVRTKGQGRGSGVRGSFGSLGCGDKGTKGVVGCGSRLHSRVRHLLFGSLLSSRLQGLSVGTAQP